VDIEICGTWLEAGGLRPNFHRINIVTLGRPDCIQVIHVQNKSLGRTEGADSHGVQSTLGRACNLHVAGENSQFDLERTRAKRYAKYRWNTRKTTALLATALFETFCTGHGEKGVMFLRAEFTIVTQD
jgi:hypothetical protein